MYLDDLIADISEAPRAPRTVNRKEKYHSRIARQGRQKGRVVSTASRHKAPNACMRRTVTNTTPYLIENAVDRIEDEGYAYVEAQQVNDRVVRVKTTNPFFTMDTFALAMERTTHGNVALKDETEEALIVELTY